MVYPYSGGPVRNGETIGRHKETPTFSKMKIELSGEFVIWDELHYLIYNIFSPLDLSESEKDITTSNEVEYLTDIFQTEDDGDSGKCKVKNDYLVQ